MRLIALLTVCATALLSLGGCALPPVLSVASFLGDGVSLMSSGKSMSDNAISTLAGEDCRLFRVLKGEWICHPESKVVAVAELPPAPPEPPLIVVAPYPRPAEPIVASVEPVTPPAPLPALGAPEHTPEHPIATAHAPAPAAPAPAAPPVAAPKPPAAAIAQAPAAAPARPATPPTPAKPARAAPPPQQQATAPVITPAALRALSGPPVRGEMVIESGRSEADAEAIAGELKGFPAKVRPVQQNGVTTYEVVVGLSG